MENKNVAVLGASPNPDRYANMAMRMLSSYGYNAIPINPGFKEIEGKTCYKKLGEVPEQIDTVTVYMGERNSTPIIDEILAVHPRRIILNPGAENDLLTERAGAKNIEVLEHCTLVMLRAGLF